MNEFLFRIFNALIGHSNIIDSVVYFLAQPTALLATLALGAYAGYEIMRTRERPQGKEVLRKWVLVFIAAFIAWFVGNLLQGFIASPRPFLDLPDAKLLFPYGDRGSFPSGHTAFLSGLTAAVCFFSQGKRLVWILLAVTLSVGFARVAAGVHWPLDILGGIVLGSAVAWGFFKMKEHFE